MILVRFPSERSTHNRPSFAQVRNLDHIHGISMNYVDASNFKLSILLKMWQLEAPHGAAGQRAAFKRH